MVIRAVLRPALGRRSVLHSSVLPTRIARGPARTNATAAVRRVIPKQKLHLNSAMSHVHVPHAAVFGRPLVGEKSIRIEEYGVKGRKRMVKIPAIWLRDHCRCPECVHPETNQRLVDSMAISPDIRVEECWEGRDEVRVLFSDGHRSTFSMDFLAKQGQLKNNSVHLEGEYSPTLWDSSIKNNPPVIDYDAVMSSEEGVGGWTALIRKYGFAYVDGCPATPEATQKLLERIAFIRHTHYGGFWDFTSDLASKDTAYTSIALEAHTDNTYFSDPAGLQMFHLLSHTDGDGGASLLVDGFKVAMDLRDQNPQAFHVLATTPITSHASGNDGIMIAPWKSRPAFVFSGSRLAQVRWNNSDRAAILMPIDATEEWYEAARAWSALVKSAENEYWEQLKPGRPLIFDNWRVLHGRSAFTGKRRLCGGYINRDDYMSRYRTLNLPNGGSLF